MGTRVRRRQLKRISDLVWWHGERMFETELDLMRSMIPPGKKQCQVCGTNHDSETPHDKTNTYYQIQFHREQGRYPTWADAMAHCNEEMQQLWRQSLLAHRLMDAEGK